MGPAATYKAQGPRARRCSGLEVVQTGAEEADRAGAGGVEFPEHLGRCAVFQAAVPDTVTGHDRFSPAARSVGGGMIHEPQGLERRHNFRTVDPWPSTSHLLRRIAHNHRPLSQ